MDVEVEHRNAANTAAGGADLSAAFDVTYLHRRNEFGSISFRLDNDDPARASIGKGSIVRGRLGGTAKLPYVIERSRPTLVSRSDEGVEATSYEGRFLLCEWDKGRLLMPPTLSNLAETVPVLDERVMAWYGPDHDLTTQPWTNSTVIAVQGWASTFYTGLPSGWSDPAALWIGPSSGDADNAPAGVNLFHRWILIGTGPAALEFGGDNYVIGYCNGKQIGTGNDFKRRQTYEFEVTRAGWMYLAFHLVNAEDDGAPGGNPTALIWSLRAGANGPVIARSDADTQILEYPTSIPVTPIGRQIRQARAGLDLLDGWTITGTDTHDETGAAYPDPGVMSFRIGKDSPWDVCRAHIDAGSIDVVSQVDGRVLRPRVKNYGSAKSLPLVTGYSTAGIADPDTVNVVDLSWDQPEVPFTALSVRWARGRFNWPATLPVNATWGDLDLGVIEDIDAAKQIATGLLTAYASGMDTATFELDPVDSTQWPLDAFTVHDTLSVPGPASHDTTTAQEVTSIQVDSTEDGDPIFRVECGNPWQDRIKLLEQAGRRGSASGALGGLTATASTADRDRVTATLNRQSEWTLFVTDADGTVGTSTPHPANLPGVAYVVSLRMRGSAASATGTTTVDVIRNGAVAATLSMGSTEEFDVALIGETWLSNDLVTVTPHVGGDGGHTGVTIQASVSEVVG